MKILDLNRDERRRTSLSSELFLAQNRQLGGP
jgi:hypothetical protein